MIGCNEVRRRVRSGDAQAVADHLAECPSCAEFAEAYRLLGDVEGAPPGEPLDLDSTFDALEERLRSQSSLRRTLAEQPTLLRLIVVMACVLLAAAAVWLLVRRVDWHHYPPLRWLLEAGGMFLVTTAYITGTLRALHRAPRPAWQRWAAYAATLAVLLMPLVLHEAHLSHPESLKGVGDDLILRALVCFLWGLAVSAAVAVPAYLASRGAGGLAQLSFAFPLAMGLFAQGALHLHCPIVHPLHIALGHTAIVPFLLVLFLAVRYLQRGHR
jgi:hypothetical protein